MASFIDPLIAFVSAHAWLAYLPLFLTALLVAVPIVGSVIPGSTIILALSALVPGGELQFEWVLAAAGVYTGHAQESPAVGHAKRVLDLLGHDRFEDVAGEFNAQMAAAMTSSHCTTYWPATMLVTSTVSVCFSVERIRV